MKPNIYIFRVLVEEINQDMMVSYNTDRDSNKNLMVFVTNNYYTYYTF